MIGSAAIVAAWQDAFRTHGKCAGQILVTHNEIKDESEGGRLRFAIRTALDNGIIPIINENDVLSDTELAKLSYGGDNDGLASKIAGTIGASALLLLTNVDGVLDERGQVVRTIAAHEYERALGMANGKSANGRGGMTSKINAAAQARGGGIKAHIGHAASDYSDILNKRIGTHFL